MIRLQDDLPAEVHNQGAGFKRPYVPRPKPTLRKRIAAWRDMGAAVGVTPFRWRWGYAYLPLVHHFYMGPLHLAWFRR